MKNFGKFIDDVKKEIKLLNISFEEVPFGETMILSIPNSTKKYILDSRYIGEIEYNTPMYSELLKMTIEQLKMFNQSSKPSLEEEIIYYKNKLKDIEELKLKYPNDQEFGYVLRNYLNTK